MQSALNTLETYVSQINTIALTDGSTPTITVTYSQFTSDAGVLADISSAYNLAVTSVLVANFASVAANSHVGAGDISVSDTAAHVQSGLATLEASISKIGTIVLVNGTTPTIYGHIFATHRRRWRAVGHFLGLQSRRHRCRGYQFGSGRGQ